MRRHWVEECASRAEGRVDRIATRCVEFVDCESYEVDPDEKPMLSELAGDLVDFCGRARGADGGLFVWSI